MEPDKSAYRPGSTGEFGPTRTVEIYSGAGCLEDTLRDISACGFKRYFSIYCEEPGANGYFSKAVGMLWEVTSDGYLVPEGEEFYTDKGKGHFNSFPCFRGASYVVQIKTPPGLEVEDGPEEMRDREVVIISSLHAREVRTLFRKAGIDNSYLRVSKGKLR